MKFRLRNALAMVGTFALVASTTAALVTVSGSEPASAAQASDPGPSTLPSAKPSAITPAVDDGRVFGIAQTGNNMVIGGSFTSVAGVAHQKVAAFNKTSGALVSGFAPTVNGDVQAVIPGPVANTVYIGGAFTQVNGTAKQFVALLNLTNGSIVSTFNAPAFNYGYVNDLVLRGSKLYVAGVFTTAGGKKHAGLAALNASTGALDASMNVQLTGHHNDSGSGAQGWVGATDFDVTADGATMVVIGNFKFADGLLRDQVAVIDLSGTSAAVSSWSTDRYSPYCYNWAFDMYVRGVSLSPDGSFFALNATGGGVPGTLCDATARFEVNNTPDSQPTWVNQTGGDTVWGVTVTRNVVYVGGHNRWENNPNGVDAPQAGAVPRAGLAAMDVNTGRTYAWNPGHVPLGVSIFAFLATPEGVWLGMDQNYIGNYAYKRQKLAYFPYAGGYTPASTATNSLPGTVYLGGSQAGGTTNVLYRVNAGGSAVQALDNGPDWTDDTSDPSPYRNNGTNVAGYDGSETVDGTVPATTPKNLFETERWSPSDSPAMDWAFPVSTGTPLQVRLYFANRYSGTSQATQRVFNVDLDGTRVLDNFDIVATTGDQRGTMKAFNITSDGTVNIDFSHVTENPLINGIEIVRTDVTPNPTDTDGLTAVDFDGTTADAAAADNQGIDFGNWRGAFKVGSTVYYGYTDGYLYSRSFNGTTFGAATKIDPYNDPYWSNISTGNGDTFRGKVPTLYGQFANVTGMTYYQGRVYYTLFGDSHLYSKWFLPDSSILDETTATQTTSVNLSSADGMFVSDDSLYYGSSTDGNLRKVHFSGGDLTGSATVVSGPTQDGVNWKNRAMFLGAGAATNPAPTAAFTSQCTSLRCTFDGTGSSDDGSVASYAWDFGDGTTGTGPTPNHLFTSGDTYDVTLTVKDNLNKSSAPVSHEITVSNSAPTAAFTFNCSGLTCSFDASGSSDSDGTVASYAWTYGDGNTDTGKTPNHPYGAADTYTVTLTVKDDVGGSSAPVSHSVTVNAQQTGVQFVGAGNAGGGNTKVKQATIPATADAGDTAVLALTQTSTSTWTGPTVVTGWTQVDTYTTGTLTTTVWVKRLIAGDVGQKVRVDSTGYSHASLDVAVYSGVDAATPVAAFAHSGDAGGTSHVTPTATAGTGDFVVSLWADRAVSTVTWTAPSGVVARDASTDTSSLTVQALVGDANGPAGAGTVGGVTATTDVATSRAAMWTIVLNAA